MKNQLLEGGKMVVLIALGILVADAVKRQLAKTKTLAPEVVE